MPWCERTRPDHELHERAVAVGNGWRVDVAQLGDGAVTVAPVLGSDVQDLSPVEALELGHGLTLAAFTAGQLGRAQTTP